jgi:putative (di)nucleoside polyphosphate hydrolase
MQENEYRLNVGVIVSNKNGNLLLCKRKGMNSWQFPQGGIDFGENSLKAAKRELFEEVGISSKSVKLIDSIDDWLKYDIPKKSRRKKNI